MTTQEAYNFGWNKGRWPCDPAFNVACPDNAVLAFEFHEGEIDGGAERLLSLNSSINTNDRNSYDRCMGDA